MKKHLFIRPVAACMAAVLTLGCLGGSVSAVNLSRDRELYAGADLESQYTYSGHDLGATWTAEATTIRAWAPTATEMQVNLYRSGNAGAKDRIDPYPMTKDANGTWVVTIPGNLHGTYYTYRVVVHGETMEVCDPYARSTGIHGQRAAILDPSITDPEGWAVDTNPNAHVPLSDVVIYQLDLQGAKGGFATLAETATGWAAPVRSLGVTHVELPALYDCQSPDEGDEDHIFEAGTDPVNFNVPEGAYATDAKNGDVRVRELKHLVQTIHSQGLSVVMNVDYTHVADPEEFPMNQIVPGYFTRVSEDGKVSNSSGFGNDTATERSMVSKYIADSICYWVEAYHIDGFRLNHLGLMDTDTIHAVVEAVHAQYPDVIFYGDGAVLETTVCVLEGTKLSAAQGLLGEQPVVIPADLEMSGELMQYWTGLVAFGDGKSHLADSDDAVMTLFNTEEQEQTVTLPDGQWQVYVNDQAAGTVVLDTVEGTVSLAPGTAMVLVQERASVEDDTQPAAEAPTQAPTTASGSGAGETVKNWMETLKGVAAPILPYLDLVVAGTLMVISGITIIAVLIRKRKQ